MHSRCVCESVFLLSVRLSFFVPKIHKNRYNFVMTTTHKFAAITSVASTPRRLCNNNPLTIIRFSSSVHRFELLLLFAAVKVLLLLLMFCVALTLCDSNRLLLALAPNKNRPRSVMKEKNSLLIRQFYCSSWCMFVRLLKRR